MHITKNYNYCDERGALLYRNLRVEEHDAHGVRVRKTFFQQRADPARKDRWINGLEGVRRVPYRLSQLTQRPGEDVHVTEGEKDADRLVRLGLCATSIADPNKIDLAVFSGRNVFVHEDNDEPGRKKAVAISAVLAEVASAVHIVRYPDAGVSGDVSSWLDLDAKRGLPEILQRCEESEATTDSHINGVDAAKNEEEPLPLYRDLPAADPFPIEALGPLEAAARAIQAQTQAPIDIAANSVLATCSLACQPHADIELPTGEKKPLSLYIITVAASGERKTSNDARALVPVKEREEQLRRQYEKEIQSYVDAHEIWKAERNKIISDKKLEPNTK